MKSDYGSYTENNTVHKPFEKLFNGKTLPELTDALSSISGETISLVGKEKRHRLLLGNDDTTELMNTFASQDMAYAGYNPLIV
jgi:hypothetical protein